MTETVKQLRQDESELQNKIQRRRTELERAEKRLKGIENVKPEYQEEYERLEVELERFYTVYVEKYTNIDYLEYELDMYNLKDANRKQKADAVIEKLKDQHARDQQNEIFEDEDDQGGKFKQMRETKTGFGAKAGYQQEGGLEPDEDDDDEDEGDEEEEDGEIDPDDEEDEESDHNF